MLPTTVLRPVRDAAPCAARGWSAADEPALPTSFSNGAAGNYNQPDSELAPAIGLAGDAASPAGSARFSTGSGWDRLVSTASVDGVQQSAPAGGQQTPDGSIISAENLSQQQWGEELGLTFTRETV